MPRAKTSASSHVSPRVAVLRDLRAYAKENGVTQAARWANVPTSTLSGWLDRRSLSPRSLERAQSALSNARSQEKQFTRETRQLRREFQNLEKLNNLPQFAKMANRQTRTIERWQRDLKSNPTPDLIQRIKKGFTRADNAATIVSEKQKVIRDKDGNQIGTRGKEVVYDAIRPPKQDADSYRIVGVDKNGNVTWSTIASEDFDGAVDEAQDVNAEYNTDTIQIILTYYS